MKITYNKADFDGACAFLAAHNPTYEGNPRKAAESIRTALQGFHDADCVAVSTAGYYLTRDDDMAGEDEVYVTILVYPGVGQPYEDTTLDTNRSSN